MENSPHLLYPALFGKWFDRLQDSGCLDLLDSILPSMDTLYENTTVYPKSTQVFRVFKMDPDNLKVIILGQDPYHSKHNGQPDACGFSFLTENGYTPPSLVNMYIELTKDTDALRIPGHWNYKDKVDIYPFTKWIEQGVMMLNTAFTVEEGKPGSHLLIWREFSSRLIKYLATTHKDVVWILLGNKAQDLLKSYDVKKIEAVHPSPLAGGKFFGSKIYSRTNELLTDKINW